MKDFIFTVDTPEGFKVDTIQYLFNSPEHRALQSAVGWRSFYLTQPEKKRVVAAVHFYTEGKLALSPYKAPFGSFVFSEKVAPEEQFKFIRESLSRLKSGGVTKVILRNPPEAYQGDNSVILNSLLISNGFTVQRTEINCTIPITEKPFEEGIDKWELRKLKQAKKAKLKCRQLPVTSFEEIYSFIERCRIERGQSLSMTAAELKHTITALPKSFLFFGVFQNEEMIAASIAIRVSKNILNNFYSAHPKSADTMSPAVLLTEGLYQWCLQQEIELLDFGTSAIGEVPNFGLLDFKLRLGGVPSARVTYSKELH